MKLHSILENTVPVFDIDKFGEALAKAINKIQKEYNSINVVLPIVSSNNLEGIQIIMFAGSNVPIANALNTFAKEVGIKKDWKFNKTSYGNDHDYDFTFNTPLDILKVNTLIKAIKKYLDDKEIIKSKI